MLRLIFAQIQRIPIIHGLEKTKSKEDKKILKKFRIEIKMDYNEQI